MHNLRHCFELIPSGGKWTEKVLHHFKHNGYDGYASVASLIFERRVTFTARPVSGTDSSCDDFVGCGTVFELTPNNGKWTEKLRIASTAKVTVLFPSRAYFRRGRKPYGTTGGAAIRTTVMASFSS